jgi:hypothetical protein
MINQGTTPVSLSNATSSTRTVTNSTTSLALSGLWVAEVNPWSLPLPWQYEQQFANTITVTNL